MTKFSVKDALVIERENETDQDGYYVSVQRAINSLGAWQMQGSMGRTMMYAIEAGRCMLGRNPTRDYFGSRIPSRTEVAPGTKGSKEFVAEMSGAEWAARMEAV